MVPPTGTQTEHGNLSQKRCDLKNVGFGGYHIYIYTYIYIYYTNYIMLYSIHIKLLYNQIYFTVYVFICVYNQLQT